MNEGKAINILKAIGVIDVIPEEVLEEVAEKGYSNDYIYGALVLDFPNNSLERKFKEAYEGITGEKDVEIYENLDLILDSNWNSLPELAKEAGLSDLYVKAYEKLVEYGY